MTIVDLSEAEARRELLMAQQGRLRLLESIEAHQDLEHNLLDYSVDSEQASQHIWGSPTAPKGVVAKATHLQGTRLVKARLFGSFRRARLLKRIQAQSGVTVSDLLQWSLAETAIIRDTDRKSVV